MSLTTGFSNEISMFRQPTEEVATLPLLATTRCSLPRPSQTGTPNEHGRASPQVA